MGSYSLELYTWRSLTSLSDLHVQLAHLGFCLLQFLTFVRAERCLWSRDLEGFPSLTLLIYYIMICKVCQGAIEISILLWVFSRFCFCFPLWPRWFLLAILKCLSPWNTFIIHQIWSAVNSFLKVFWKKFMRIVLHLRRRLIKVP